MLRNVPRSLVAAMAAVAALAAVAPSAGAAVVNGCTTGMFPNTPGGTSGLKVACTLTTASAAVGSVNIVEDFPEAVWHFGAARVTAADGHTTSGSATITSATARFNAANDVNHGISGAGIPATAIIQSVTNATTAVLNMAATATGTTAVFTIENSDGRSVADASTTSGSTTITSATARFRAADVGRFVTGTNIPHGAKIASVTNVTTAVLSAAATATGSNQKITIQPATTTTTARQVDDAHTTIASKTVTSAQAKFGATDKGLNVTGAGIPAGAFIAVVTNATTITLSVAATATSTTAVLTIGRPNAVAPTDSTVVAHLGAELNLNPALVAGTDDCANHTPEGFNIEGIWHNPGSFDGAALGSSNATQIKAAVVGQIVYPTSVIAFAAYVEQVPANLAGESNTAAHYDVVYPFLPTGLALCGAPDATGVASTFQFDAVSVNQQAATIGTPLTNNVRGLRDFPVGTATKATKAFIHITDGSGLSVFQSNSTCTETYPGVPDYACGNG